MLKMIPAKSRAAINNVYIKLMVENLKLVTGSAKNLSNNRRNSKQMLLCHPGLINHTIGHVFEHGFEAFRSNYFFSLFGNRKTKET